MHQIVEATNFVDDYTFSWHFMFKQHRTSLKIRRVVLNLIICTLYKYNQDIESYPLIQINNYYDTIQET